jgi:hypothetical protein
MSDGPGQPPTDGGHPAVGGHPPTIGPARSAPLSPAEAAAAAAAAAVAAAEAAKAAAAAAAAAAGHATPGSTSIPTQRSTGNGSTDVARRRGGRLRGSWKVFAVLMALVCVGGGVLGYVVYDRATKIDRSSPTVVVLQYVFALFDPYYDREPESFECERLTEDGIRRELMVRLKEIEDRDSIQIDVSSGNYEVTTGRASSDVLADLYIEVPEVTGRSSISTQRWLFQLQDRDGWRVCGTRRVG